MGQTALMGLLFWSFVSHNYQPDEVGVAAAAVSAVMLAGMLSTVGINFAFIRHLPSKQYVQRTLVSTGLFLGLTIGVIGSGVLLTTAYLWSPFLYSLRADAVVILIALLATPAWTLSILLDSIFTGTHRTHYVLTKNLSFNLLKLLGPLLFLALGVEDSKGIFYGWGLPLIGAVLFALFVFLPRVGHKIVSFSSFSLSTARMLLGFSFANYFTTIGRLAPGYVIALLVVHRLSEEDGAYFYLSWTAVALLISMSYVISNVLVVQGSMTPPAIAKQTRIALLLSFAMLLPIAIVMFVFAETVLQVFGASYSEHASGILRLLVASVPSIIIIQIYLAVQRIREDFKLLITVPLFATSGSVIGAYFVMPQYGLPGVGAVWLGIQTITALLVAPSLLGVLRSGSNSAEQIMPREDYEHREIIELP